MENSVKVFGFVKTEPHIIEENDRFTVWEFILGVARTSGVIDEVPCRCGNKIVEKIKQYDNVFVDGSLRSHNNNGKCEIFIWMFGFDNDIVEYHENNNVISTEGYIARISEVRKTPLGREIADVILAINYRNGKSSYIPCVFWGMGAKAISNVGVGKPIHIDARFQSREYQKKLADGSLEERVAYEVSVSNFEEVA